MTDFFLLLVLWMVGVMLFPLFPSKILLGLLLSPVLAWAMYCLVRLAQRMVNTIKPWPSPPLLCPDIERRRLHGLQAGPDLSPNPPGRQDAANIT